MLLADFIRESTLALRKLYPEPEAGNIVALVCEKRFGTKNYTHIIDPGRIIDENAAAGDIRRLLDWEPVQYVLGKACFCGREFNVCPGVLIPRPETEILVELAEKSVSSKKNPAILDLCTGSGCIAWTLKKDIPGSEVTGVDISDEALATAAGQFEGPSPIFVRADILKNPGIEGSFDLITCNPPYICECEKTCIRPNVLDFEPPEALFVPDEDPLVFYRAVARWASILLKENGEGIVEINERFGNDTASVFLNDGFAEVAVIRDISGKDRFISFRKQAA